MTEKVNRVALRDPTYATDSATCQYYDCGMKYTPTVLEQKYCTRTCKSATNMTFRNRRKEES